MPRTAFRRRPRLVKHCDPSSDVQEGVNTRILTRLGVGMCARAIGDVGGDQALGVVVVGLV